MENKSCNFSTPVSHLRQGSSFSGMLSAFRLPSIMTSWYGTTTDSDSHFGQLNGSSDNCVIGYRKLDYPVSPGTSIEFSSVDPPSPATSKLTLANDSQISLSQALAGFVDCKSSGYISKSKFYTNQPCRDHQNSFFTAPYEQQQLSGEEAMQWWQYQPPYLDQQLYHGSDLTADVGHVAVHQSEQLINNLTPADHLINNLASDLIDMVDAVSETTTWLRQAFRTLARSNLNPNAAEFTPKAKAADSLATLSTTTKPFPIGDRISPSEYEEPSAAEVARESEKVATMLSQTNSPTFFLTAEMGDKEEKETNVTGVKITKSPTPRSKDQRNSSESSNDSFILFTSSSPPAGWRPGGSLLARDPNDSEESEESDWDSDSEGGDELDGSFMDCDELKEFFPLLCLSSLTTGTGTVNTSSRDYSSSKNNSHSDGKDNSNITSNKSSSTSCCSKLVPPRSASPLPSFVLEKSIRCCFDSFPAAVVDHRSLAEINARWRALPAYSTGQLQSGQSKAELQRYPSHKELHPHGPSYLGSQVASVVRFNLETSVILEPEDQAEELRLARISDFNQRQADRERMERLLAPILTTTHRAAVWHRLTFNQPPHRA